MKKYHTLTPDVLDILQNKGTELAFSGRYLVPDSHGTYVCRGCGHALFVTEHQLISHCGWPSFDNEISGAVRQCLDADHCRTEIVCAYCLGHLGHVFYGEKLTKNNVRYCVNSRAIELVNTSAVRMVDEAIFAAGCFWGVEHLFLQLAGIVQTEVGYTGGDLLNPTYEQVCGGATGHYEAVRILYDPAKIDYQRIVEFFFEIHDPTQSTGQGPDYGSHYLSAIFYQNGVQQQIAQCVVKRLEKKVQPIVTILRPATVFWPAEQIHQHYYQKQGGVPYCHHRVKKF